MAAFKGDESGAKDLKRGGAKKSVRAAKAGLGGACPVEAFSRFVVGRRGDLLRRVFLIVVARGIRFWFFPIVAECREGHCFRLFFWLFDAVWRRTGTARRVCRLCFSFVVSASDKRFDRAIGRVFSRFFCARSEGCFAREI